MNDEDTKDAIARLLRSAGHRTLPSEAANERLRVHAHAAWRAELARRRRDRWIASAASFVVLVGAAWWAIGTRVHLPGQLVADVEQGVAEVRLLRAGQETGLDAARQVRTGDRLFVSGDHGAVLRPAVAEDVSLRLAPQSRVEWLSPREMRLLDGAVYVGVLPAQGEAVAKRMPLVVLAGQARIEHVGTQYQVVVRAGSPHVVVREGLVRVAVGRDEAVLAAGEAGFVDADGAMKRERFADGGADWRWVAALAPSLVVEGRSLHDALSDVAREEGRHLEYDSEAIAAAARGTVLHGPPLTLPPADAAKALLSTTGFAAPDLDGRATGGDQRLRVTLKARPPTEP